MNSVLAIAMLAGVAIYSANIVLHAQDAVPAAAPGPDQAKAKGKGKGRPPAVDTLGEGPWDLKSEKTNIRVTVVTKGLDHPWGLAFVPGGDMLVTERGGRLRVVRKGVLDPTPISGLPEIRAVSLGGLMDISLHPNFAQNRLIYFTYSKPGAEDPAHATTAVGRARWDGGPALTDVKDVFVAMRGSAERAHPRAAADKVRQMAIATAHAWYSTGRVCSTSPVETGTTASWRRTRPPTSGRSCASKTMGAFPLIIRSWGRRDTNPRSTRSGIAILWG